MSDAPIIAARDVTIGWTRESPLVEHASFSVARSEIFTILGGSGSGKSTLLRALMGLDEPLAGTIELFGEPIGLLKPAKPRFGVMFQSGALFGSLTVLENVSLPLREWTRLPVNMTDAMALAKLRLVGLDGAAEKLPAELSGGMKKRAAIARALALEPALLFLDEPTAGLDPVTSADIDELILTLNRALGLTVVLVTHELESIRKVSSRCLMIDARTHRVIAEGPPDELARSDDPVVAEFFRREARSAA